MVLLLLLFVQFLMALGAGAYANSGREWLSSLVELFV